MGGGLMQLVAVGAQDVFLSSNPQITFFKVVYRRHTNFSCEPIEQTINGSQKENASGTVTVSRNGDLIHRVYVNVDAAADAGNGDDVVSTAEVEIGGQKIDEHTKEWNQIWNELTVPASKADAFKCMTGNVGYAKDHGVGQVQIPLNFWFCRNAGLALPLIALQYHEVKIKCTWGAFVGTRSVLVDYIYLDTEERRRFAQVSHEYLIEQVQKNVTYVETDTSVDLHLNHPVKELIWTSPATNAYGKARIVLNGQDRFAELQEEYFQLRQPLDHHTAVPGANVPLSARPQMLATPIDSGVTQYDTTAEGNTNVKIAAGSLSFDTTPTAAEITAFNNLWKEGDLFVYDVGGDAADPARTTVHTVTSITAAAATTAGVVNVSPANMVVPTSADDKVSITIIARAQDPLGRVSRLAKKVNVYSFALKPEEHQPSGTLNFSRIDTAQLKFSNNPGGTGPYHVYAVNYNILRIQSGMGGLAYSN
jgi:hypothetical protein